MTPKKRPGPLVSSKFVEYMGGALAVIAKAKQDFVAGNYRWVAQVMNQVVFADPNNKEARELEADALEQLGYQAESGPWRSGTPYDPRRTGGLRRQGR